MIYAGSNLPAGGVMADKVRSVRTLELVGGRLCLDWANTASARSGTERYEYLASYADLLEWSRRTGILTQRDVRRLEREATRNPGEAAATLDRAIAMRETVYRIFAAIANRQSPKKADLGSLNAMLAEAQSRLRVQAAGTGFAWQWAWEPHALDVMLWPIVRSAGDLLTSSDLYRVRQCARRLGCGWLFVDASRNQSRRWCSMSMCGSRVKSSRYYHRKRAVRQAKT
jgi:predicted RNA-binding Zn ribbon-like protein